MKRSNNYLGKANLLIGTGLLITFLHYLLPDDFIPIPTLPFFILGIGLLVGILTSFKHPVSFALLGIGGMFLFNTDLPMPGGWHILPIMFIITGIFNIFVTKRELEQSKQMEMQHSK